MKLILRFSLTTFLLAALVQLSGCSGGDKSSQTQANTGTSVAAPRQDTPMFSAMDIQGNLHSSSEWIGQKPVVLNFWGTWCPPCRREIPDLVKLYEEYHLKGVEIISLAVNDTPGKVKSYSEQNNMGWVMLMAQDQILYDFSATQGIPTTIFIDKNGQEVGRFIGMRDYATLKRGFDAII